MGKLTSINYRKKFQTVPQGLWLQKIWAGFDTKSFANVCYWSRIFINNFAVFQYFIRHFFSSQACSKFLNILYLIYGMTMSVLMSVVVSENTIVDIFSWYKSPVLIFLNCSPFSSFQSEKTHFSFLFYFIPFKIKLLIFFSGKLNT